MAVAVGVGVGVGVDVAVDVAMAVAVVVGVGGGVGMDVAVEVDPHTQGRDVDVGADGWMWGGGCADADGRGYTSAVPADPKSDTLRTALGSVSAIVMVNSKAKRRKLGSRAVDWVISRKGANTSFKWGAKNSGETSARAMKHCTPLSAAVHAESVRACPMAPIRRGSSCWNACSCALT